QVWLALGRDENFFVERVLDYLSGEFSSHPLVFKYLPPGTPVGWISRRKVHGWHCWLETCDRPLVRIEDQRMLAEHLQRKTKSKRHKLNRMKRLGELRFERILDPHQLEPIFDELIA